MARKSKLLLPILFIAVILVVNFSGCCSSSAEGQNVKSGIVKMTGHEPFAKLTLIVSDAEAYALECKGKVKEELMNNLGSSYTVEYSDVKEEMKQKILVVTKVIKNSKQEIQ